VRVLGVKNGLFISVRFVHHGASFPVRPQGLLGGRPTKSVSGGGRSSGRGQARLVRGAGATADRLWRPTQQQHKSGCGRGPTGKRRRRPETASPGPPPAIAVRRQQFSPRRTAPRLTHMPMSGCYIVVFKF
jgi:hypothetical protein